MGLFGRGDRQRFRADIAAKYGTEARTHLILASIKTRELTERQRYGTVTNQLMRECTGTKALFAEKIRHATGLSEQTDWDEATNLIQDDIDLSKE